MSDKEIISDLVQQLTKESLKDFNPTILIGKAATVFKRICKSQLYTITTAKEVKEFLSKWDTPLDTPIIFEDISLMTPSVQTYLLKFIEEPIAPLIIMASKDNISPIILSRCKKIIKYPEPLSYGHQSLQEFIENKQQAQDEIYAARMDPNSHTSIPESVSRYFDHPEQTALEDCPEYLFMSKEIEAYTCFNKDKYLELL